MTRTRKTASIVAMLTAATLALSACAGGEEARMTAAEESAANAEAAADRAAQSAAEAQQAAAAAQASAERVERMFQQQLQK